MNFFTAFFNEKSPPVLKKLYGGRWRMTRTLLLADGTEMAEATFPPRGTRFAYECSDDEKALVLAAGINPDDFHLIDMGTGGDRKEIEIISVWETLTGTLVDADKPKVDYDLNGLKRITHTLIGLPDIDMSTYDFVVGVSEHATGGPVLAQFKDDTDDAATKITAVYLQPGVVSKSRRAGEIAGTTANTWQVFHSDPEPLMITALGTIVVTADDDSNVQGYPTRSVTALSGGVTGVKFTYPAPVEVTTPGIITLATIEITAGGLTGTDAVIRAVPPRKKTVTATVTISIVSSPPSTVANAYNLENISCSVTNTRATFSYKGSDVYTTTNGTNSTAVAKYGANIGADISTYPGYFLTNTTASGCFSYTAGSQASGLNTNTVAVSSLTANITNTLTGSGSYAATGFPSGYSTTGILQQKARPVLTALDGTTYWELITWTV